MNTAKKIKREKSGAAQWRFMAQRIAMKTKELFPNVSSTRKAELDLDEPAQEATMTSGMEM